MVPQRPRSFRPRLAPFGIALAVAVGLPREAAAAMKVACVGEHSTNSAHVSDPQEYPPRMQTLLGATFEVKNFGFPTGKVIPGGDGQSYLTTAEFMASLAFAPDVVVLGPWGRHDAGNGNYNTAVDPAAFELGLNKLIDSYDKLASKPRILLPLPIPYPFGTGVGVMSKVLLPVTEKVAKARGLATVDLWAAYKDQKAYFSNSDHFTPEGIQLMASVIGKTLQAALAPPGSDAGSTVRGPDGSAASPTDASAAAAAPDAGPVPRADSAAANPANSDPSTNPPAPVDARSPTSTPPPTPAVPDGGSSGATGSPSSGISSPPAAPISGPAPQVMAKSSGCQIAPGSAPTGPLGLGLFSALVLLRRRTGVLGRWALAIKGMGAR